MPVSTCARSYACACPEAISAGHASALSSPLPSRERGGGEAAAATKRSALERHDLLLLFAQPVYAEPHHVTAFEEYGFGFHAQAHPRRRAGGDDVARHQRHELADVTHDGGHVED